MMARLRIAEVEHASMLSDPCEPAPARLEALHILMTGSLSRPVASARWRAMRASIDAELGRRAALEQRSPSAVLHDELQSAITLASGSARLIAMRAFIEVFK